MRVGVGGALAATVAFAGAGGHVDGYAVGLSNPKGGPYAAVAGVVGALLAGSVLCRFQQHFAVLGDQAGVAARIHVAAAHGQVALRGRYVDVAVGMYD